MDIRWEKMPTKTVKGRKSQRSTHSKPTSTKSKSKSPQQLRIGRVEDEQQENVCPGVQDVGSSYKKKHKRTASLTDLRPEDKKKVANLIQELANLGSEKEKIESRLNKEREDFEGAIKDLVNDQKALLAERKAVQTELNSCQQMLNQLQEAVLHRPTSSSALLHRPTSSSALASQRGDNPNNISSNGVRPNNGDISRNAGSDFDRNSALDLYLSRHNSTQESMDATSEVESVTSEAVKNPRTSSTLIGEPQIRRKESNSWLHSVISHGDDGSDRNNTNSTINYSRKDELVFERAKLIEEQRLLRQKLFEQEGLLRRTQKLLYYKELEQEAGKRHHLAHRSRECEYASLPPADKTYTKNSSPPRTLQSLCQQTRTLQSISHPSQTQTLHPPHSSSSYLSRGGHPSQTQTLHPPHSTSSYLSRGGDSRTGYNIGVQVDNPDQPLNASRSGQIATHDHAVQTELPLQSSQRSAIPSDHNRTLVQSNPRESQTGVQLYPDNSLNFGSEGSAPSNKLYIGNRLVPSPSNRIARNNSSMEKTIEKTSRLLESARKVIDDVRSPRTVVNAQSTRGILSNTTSSQVSKSSLSHCNHSYQVYTPRKSHRELFDEDASLATEINSESMAEEGGGSARESAADITELELLEDIFYVR